MGILPADEKVADQIVLGEKRARFSAELMTEEERTLFLRIRNNCRKCHGSGKAGFTDKEDTGFKKPVACDCVHKAINRIIAARLKPLAGLEIGRQYSIGVYVGPAENKLLGGMYHAFKTKIFLVGGAENSEIYIPVEDKARIRKLKAEKRMEVSTLVTS